MATFQLYDTGGDPGFAVNYDDVLEQVVILTRDDAAAPSAAEVFTPAQVQRIITLMKAETGGAVNLDPDDGIIIAITPDNRWCVTIRKDAATMQEATIAAADAQAILGFLEAYVPGVTP